MSWFLNWSDLRVGRMYFLLGYHDPQRLYPYIETLVYMGAEVQDQTAERHHVFSYVTADTIAKADRVVEEEDKLRFVDSDPSCIGDLDGLIKELQQCRMRLGEQT